MKYTTNLISKLSDDELKFWLQSETETLKFARNTFESTSAFVGVLAYEVERREIISAKSDMKFLLGITTVFTGKDEPTPSDFINLSRSTLFEIFAEIQSETTNAPEDLKARFTAFEKDVADAFEDDYMKVPF